MAESTSIKDFAVEGPVEAPAVAEWEKHRAAIEDIYLVDNFTVLAMIDVMKEQYDFEETSESYYAFIGMWGLQFKDLIPWELAALGLLRRNRERLNPEKRTMYSVRNRYIDMKRLRSYLQRHKPRLVGFLDLTKPRLNIDDIRPEALKVRCSTPPHNASHEFIVPPVASIEAPPATPISKEGNDVDEASIPSHIQRTEEKGQE